MISAESSYLFRHALLREAAYQLQPLAQRARLHRSVVEIAEALWGVPPPHRASELELKGRSLPLDPHADEICRHIELALAAAAGTAEAEFLRGRLSLHLRRAAQLADIRFENVKVASLFERLATEFADVTGTSTMDLLRACSAAAFDDLAHAEKLCLRGLEASRGMVAEPVALRDLARIYILQWRMGDAARVLERALDMFCAAGDHQNEALCLGYVAAASVNRLTDGEAEACFQRALATARAYGIREQEWSSLVNYSNLLLKTGRNAEAENVLRQVVEPGPSQADPDYRAVAQGNLAEILAARGEGNAAEEHFRQSLAGHRRLGNRVQEGWIAAQLGKLLLGQGRLDEAEVLLHAAEDTLERIGHTPWLGGLGAYLAEIELQRGRAESAEHNFMRALRLQHKYAPEHAAGLVARMERARAAAGLPPRAWPAAGGAG